MSHWVCLCVNKLQFPIGSVPIASLMWLWQQMFIAYEFAVLENEFLQEATWCKNNALCKCVDLSYHEVCVYGYNPSPGISWTIRWIVTYPCRDCSLCGSTIRHLWHIQAMDYSKSTIPFYFYSSVLFGSLVSIAFNLTVLSLRMILQAWNHRHYNSRPEDGLSSFQLFLCGLAAGTCAKLVCHPLDVVKKRFQVHIFTPSIGSGFLLLPFMTLGLRLR